MDAIDTMMPLEQLVFLYLFYVSTYYNYYPEDLCNSLPAEKAEDSNSDNHVINIITKGCKNNGSIKPQDMPWEPPIPAFSALYSTSRLIEVMKIRTPTGKDEQPNITDAQFYTPEGFHIFDLRVYSRFISALTLWNTGLSPIEYYLSSLHKPISYAFNLTNKHTNDGVRRDHNVAINCVRLLALGVGIQEFLQNGCLKAAELLVDDFLERRKKISDDLYTTKGLSELNFKKFLGLYFYLKLHRRLGGEHKDSIKWLVDNRLKTIKGFSALKVDLATMYKHKESTKKSVETGEIMPTDASKAAFNSEIVYELVGWSNTNENNPLHLINKFDALEISHKMVNGELDILIEDKKIKIVQMVAFS